MTAAAPADARAGARVRRRLTTLAGATVVGVTLACSPTGAPSTPAWDAALTSELQRRGAEDEAARAQLIASLQAGGAPDSTVLAQLAAVDSANAQWLASTVTTHGWPRRSVVGADAASAAFLIVQHATHDTTFQVAMLRELATAVERREADGESLALLTDRVARQRGLPQVYGTQADVRDGRVILDPIADSAGVDHRRAQLGMVPLAAYVRLLDSLYLGRTTP